MAIVQTLCTSFKQEMLLAQHNLVSDTLKIALYTSMADLGASTTVYTTTEEVVGTGYTAGGEILTGATVLTSGTTAYVSFDNPAWAESSITARGALIYNTSNANKAIAVLNFGADKTSSNTPFTIQMPANDAANALIRFP